MNWSMTCLIQFQRDLGVDSAPVSLNKTRRATLKSRAFFGRPKKLVTRLDRSETGPQNIIFKKNEKCLNGIKTNRVLDIRTFTTFRDHIEFVVYLLSFQNTPFCKERRFLIWIEARVLSG